MVRLTVDLILRCSSTHAKKQRDESRKHFLRRLTHLHLENKEINEVGDELISCRHLVVLYLYDNSLMRIPLLSRNVNLSHLYLQNNRIEKIEGLSSLTALTKLYLGGNRIVVVEGLEALSQLQELHVEKQHLPGEEKMLFDFRSLQAIAGSLLVLNISSNGVTSLEDLQCLRQLRHLMTSDNRLADVTELSSLLSTSWRHLERLDVTNNPLCRRAKYRDHIIIAAPALEELDGVEVTETARRFLRSWQANKDAIRQKMETGRRVPGSDDDGLGDVAAVDDDRAPGQSASVLYPDVPPAFQMPALHGARFKKFLARSRSRQDDRERVDPRFAMDGLFGYDSMYDQPLGQSAGHQAARGTGSASMGQRAQHLSLHNISLDQQPHPHNGYVPV